MVAPARRLEWVDRARGWGIILVVLGHTSTISAVNSWIYAFHMPVFFWLSGYLYTGRSFLYTVKKRSLTLLVPYFFFGALTWVYWALWEQRWRSGSADVWGALANLFIARAGTENYPANVVLWFLPCLFVVEIVFAGLGSVVKFFGKGGTGALTPLAFTVVVTAAFAGLAFTVSDGPRLPWALDIVPIGLAFYAAGFLCNQWGKKATRMKQKQVLTRWRTPVVVLARGGGITIAGAALVLFVSRFSLAVDLNNLVAHPYGIFLVAAATGTFGVVQTAKLFSFGPVVSSLGRASLVVLCLHEPVKRVVLQLVSMGLPYTVADLREDPFWVSISVAVTLAVCWLVSRAFSRWLPVLVGNPSGALLRGGWGRA